MTHPTDLIAVYTAWDIWAHQLSERTSTPTSSAGQRVAAQLVDAEKEAARSLGFTHSQLHDRIVTGRRAGLTITDAILQALEAAP